MRVAAPLLLACTALATAVPVYHLPPVSPDFDAIAVFMPGGLPPNNPWGGLSDGFRERFWTLGCRGFLMQRTAWCAYLALTPPGCAGLFIDEMASLGDSSVMTDTTVWAGILQLEPLDLTGALAVAWHETDAIEPPPFIPVRQSLWLAAGNDTLIANGPWSNSVFLWTPGDGEPSSNSAAWRGTGTEVVPTGGGGSVMIGVHTASGVTPAELGRVFDSGHPWDEVFAPDWGLLIGEIEGLVADFHPPEEGRHNLLWLKGAGSGRNQEPWKTIGIPGPPARARIRVSTPEGLIPFPSPDALPEIEGISCTTFPCIGATRSEILVFSGVFERILARGALPGIEGGVSVAVTPARDSVRVWITGDVDFGGEDPRAVFSRLLGPTALCPPESALVANAALRAFVMHGEPVAPPAPTVMVHLLAGALGLLNGIP